MTSNKNITVIQRHLYAQESSNGYSWTLTTVLGECLLMAEALFGPRDQRYTLLGID